MSVGVKTFVANECANWSDGRCIMLESKRCSVTEGKRCSYLGASQGRRQSRPYFEFAVLPLGESDSRYAEAMMEYQGKHGLNNSSLRFCDCGAPLPERKRLCPDCRKKRRSKAAAKSRRRKRS